MVNCLHIACLQYHLLLDAQHVREVLELDAADEGYVHGCRLWRGGTVQVLDLRTVLGEPEPSLPRAGLVYGEHDPPLLLLCDSVLGLVQSDETAFRKLPYSAGPITDLVDAVVPDAATGRLLFHLKPGITES